MIFATKSIKPGNLSWSYWFFLRMFFLSWPFCSVIRSEKYIFVTLFCAFRIYSSKQLHHQLHFKSRFFAKVL